MSVVIVGGHDRMVRQYMDICKNTTVKEKYLHSYPAISRDRLVRRI